MCVCRNVHMFTLRLRAGRRVAGVLRAVAVHAGGRGRAAAAPGRERILRVR